MLKIAVINSKGGVGKTTLSCALAVRASQDGKRIAMVDMDPQRSLIEWWKRRGKTDNPLAYDGVDTPAEAVERLEQTGLADIVFFDGPPAFLTLMQEMAEAVDFVVIPIKASTLDLLATQDAVVIAQQAKRPFLVVINDVGPYEAKIVDSSRNTLLNKNIPVAATVIRHRPSHIAGMTVGKSGAEVDRGKDKLAIADLDALWLEVKAAADKAVKAAKKHAKVAHG